MEALMEAVAEAISHAEREAAEAQETTTPDAALTGEEPALTGPERAGTGDRGDEARGMASNFYRLCITQMETDRGSGPEMTTARGTARSQCRRRHRRRKR